MKNPVYRLLATLFCLDALFLTPVALAYYQLKGLDLAGFFLLQSIFRISIMVLEIPTGYISDNWTRKKQLLVASVFWLISLTILFVYSGVYPLIIATLFHALASSFKSGTKQAYLYEILKEKEQENDHIWQGRLFALSMIADTGASFLGGWLFTLNVHLPVASTMIFALIAILIGTTLPNIPKTTRKKAEKPLKDIAHTLQKSLLKHPELPWIILSSWPIIGLSNFLFWSIQSRLISVQTPYAFIGGAFGLYFFIKAFVAVNLNKLPSKNNKTFILILLLCLVLGSCIMTIDNAYVIFIGGTLAAGIVHTLAEPISISLINKHVDNHERATIISIANMAAKIVSASIMLVLPILLQFKDLKELLLLIPAATLILLTYPLYRFYKI